MTKEIFFDSNVELISQLTRLQDTIDSLPANDTFEKQRNNHVAYWFRTIVKNPSFWDGNCQINIEWLKEHLRNILSAGKKELTSEVLDDIFSTGYRFITEAFISSSSELSNELKMYRSFADTNLHLFSPSAKNQIEWANTSMLVNIIKKLVSNGDINIIHDFDSIIEKSKVLTDQLSSNVDDYVLKISTFNETLVKFKSEFNFVGLSQGFKSILSDKKSERFWARVWTIFFGFVVLLPIATEILYFQNLQNEINASQAALISISILSATAIIIYFFRINLHNLQSVKSQIMQLELRLSLCQFIESYTEYAKEIKTKDKEALSKFENIIFSSIVASDEKLPSTYDGLDQLQGIIKTLRGS